MAKRVRILRQTLKAAEDGCYTAGEREVKLPYDFERIKAVRLYSAEQTAQLAQKGPAEGKRASGRIALSNQDTLEAALGLHRRREEHEKPVLVLNFANPHRPGGGIRARPGTQEEHLCVKTTLLCSLETEEAWPFYQANLDCGTQAQKDAVLFSPGSVVIRNPDLSLREDPFPIAVMTVSAPIVSRMEPEELPGLEEILSRRIRGMLRAALEEGYSRIVLGAWGCGNFGNDPDVVARLFRDALLENKYAGAAGSSFEEVVMAVLDLSEDQSRYRAFAAYFPEGEG